jgi:hypothetical protein
MLAHQCDIWVKSGLREFEELREFDDRRRQSAHRQKLVLLLNDVNHPRHAVFIGDFTETVRPEGFLPGHFDIPASGEVVEPALAFINVLRVEHQREPAYCALLPGGIPSLIMISLPAMRTLEWAIAESGNCMPDGQPSSLLSLLAFRRR